MPIGIPRRDINLAARHLALAPAIIRDKARLDLFKLRSEQLLQLFFVI
ncbi:MAG: hypothetical protein KGN98_05095 [Alphaproteobacteria bacterium]|jgi:hypothetical protein|nr:hypothetical protein [Alphaproteobacteria bacterium]